MDNRPTNRCGYTWPKNGITNPSNHQSNASNHQSCCYRPTLPNSDQCAWHTESKASVELLKEARTPRKIREQNSPMGELLDGANLSGSNIKGLSLENVSLRDANFSGSDLQFANLSESDLRGANLSETIIHETSFFKSDLRDAILPTSGDQPLSSSDFTGGDLRGVEFPDDIPYLTMERSFIFQHPIDFDPDGGVNNDRDIISINTDDGYMVGIESLDYFGPPTADIGRLVCMANWPNINVGESIGILGWTADFSEKRIHDANFSGAHLWGADFSDSFLANSDFSDATLWMTDFSDANLQNANLKGTDLRNADLTGADLRDVDLTDADLRRADISDVHINGGTKCGQLYEHPELNHNEWNSIARAYHELKVLFGDNGLTGRARSYHALQRRVRGLEAKARDGWTNTVYLGSKLSGLLTGYGVRVQYLLGWMIVLFLSSTAWYVLAGVENSILRNITYSVITFTTSPPSIPSGRGTQIIAMIETFFGTLLVVLLGYILGNREQF